MTARAEEGIRGTTIGCVAVLAASLAANVAVAEPTATGRVIAAWPSFALIASYELLMRQVRHAAEAGTSRQMSGGVQSRPGAASSAGRLDVRRPDEKGSAGRGREAQVLAWQWALANSCGDGWPSWLPTPRWHRRSAAGAAGRCRTVRLPAAPGIR